MLINKRSEDYFNTLNIALTLFSLFCIVLLFSSRHLFLQDKLAFFSIVFLLSLILICVVVLSFLRRKESANSKVLNTALDVLEQIKSKNYSNKTVLDEKSQNLPIMAVIEQIRLECIKVNETLEEEVLLRTTELSEKNEELGLKQQEVLQQYQELIIMQEALIESQNRYENLIHILEDEYFFFSRSSSGDLLFVSRSIEKILGLKVKDFRQKYKELLPDSEINQQAANHERLSLQGVQQPKYMMEILDSKNEIHHFSILEIPMYNEDGLLVSVEGLAHDVSVRYKNEELIREQEEKYRMVFNHASDFMYLFNLKEDGSVGNIIEANNYMVESLGYSREELLKMSPVDLEISAPEDFDEENHYSTVFERVWQNILGIFVHVEISEFRFTIKGKEVGIAIARDFTDRKKIQDEIRFMNEELINQKENLEALVDNLTQAQEQLVHSEKLAALGQLISGVAHEINTPLGAIKASIGNLSEALDRAMDGIPLLFHNQSVESVKLFLLVFTKARVKKVSLSSREKRQIRKDIYAQLEEKRIKDADFIADLFVYLEISDYADEIIREFPGTDPLRVLSAARNFISILKNSQTISIGVEKATKVVFALKKYAHRDSLGEKVPTDIIDGIETVLTLYHSQIKQGVELVRNYSTLPTVMCYQDEINQVWTNLIQNAIHAMPKGGILTIVASECDNEIVVAVCDNGMGIEPDIIHRIFEPFYTTKKQGEGSGLGLDIVKKIIDKHEGSIDLKSTLGEGTTFTVKIPIA